MPQFDQYSSWMIPTVEDRLDVDFWAIVSDCRAIVLGTLKPTPWAEISGTWTPHIKEPVRHRNTETKRRCSESRKAYYASKVRPLNQKQVQLFRRMVSILEKNGCNVWDARMKARELLGLDGPIEIHR